MVLWRPSRPSKANTKKDILFIIGNWNAKVGSQEIPGVTSKFDVGVQNEAGQRLNRVLPGECTGHSKHPLPTTQEMTLYMDMTRWSTVKSDWLYALQLKMKKLYMVSKRVQNAVLGHNLKNGRMISVRFQGKPFNIMVIQIYAPTSNTEETEVDSFMKTYNTFYN